MTTRDQVFISYAHEDASWRDAFVDMFKPAVERGSIRLWSDANIPVGAEWRRDIDKALNSARAGLLLVTPSFLKSEFITELELKRLLNVAKTAGTTIYWVPVSPTLHEQSALSDIQSAWDPDRPLDQLPESKRPAAIQRICRQIIDDFGFLLKVTGSRRQALPQQVQDRLGPKYKIGEELGTGSFSIVYRAQQVNPARTVGVKVLVASEFDDWASRRFKEIVGYAAELTSPAFIRIIETWMDELPELLVMEFVDGEPLSKYLLRYPNGVPLTTARRILVELASALEEVHSNNRMRGEICSSNILMSRTGAARLSAVDFSTVLSEESQVAANFLVDRESLAYMTPERFYGRPLTPLTDQYTLGLIAMELLGGQRVPRVLSPSDLEGKGQWFADVAAAKGRWAQRSQGFTGIVSRLLRIDPAARWSSMKDVRHYLRDLDVAESAEDMARTKAKASFVSLQSAGTERAIYRRFYEKLFAVCPDVAERFRAIDMEQQYTMLNKAVQLLLEFEAARGSTALRALAEKHSPFGLSRRHYELFLQSLLEAIADFEHDRSKLDAWRKTMTPAVDFMCSCAGARADDSHPVSVAAQATN